MDRLSYEGTIAMLHGIQVAAGSAIMSLLVWPIKTLEFILANVHRCVICFSRMADEIQMERTCMYSFAVN